MTDVRGTCPGNHTPGSVRDERLDAMRGLAIVLVVLGHALVRAPIVEAAGTPGAVLLEGIGFVRLPILFAVLLNAIYSVHIPLLAFVSGFVLSHSSVGFGTRFVGRRFAGLMVPYLAWLALAWVATGEHTLAGFGRFFGAGILNPQSPGGLWYLYALFVGTVILAAVMTVGRSTSTLILSGVIVGLAGIVPLNGYDHILGLSDVAWVYPFVVAGVLVSRHRTRLDGLRWALPVTLSVWLVTLPLVWQVLVPGERWWYAPAAALLHPLGTSLVAPALKGLWAVVRLIGALSGVTAAYYAYAHVTGVFLKVQAWIGKRTLGIYATHGWLLLIPLGTLGLLPRAAALFAIALAGSIALTLALERTKLTRRVLLGIRR